MVEHREVRCGGVGWLLAAIFVAGATFGIYRATRDPERVELVHTEYIDGWTARLLKVGRYSESSLAWTGRPRYTLELEDPTSAIHRVHTNITEREPALDFMRAEVARRAEDR